MKICSLPETHIHTQAATGNIDAREPYELKYSEGESATAKIGFIEQSFGFPEKKSTWDNYQKNKETTLPTGDGEKKPA